MEGSQLMHDAVRVVERHGALLAQPLPLEGGAQGAHLLLLVLLLLGKLHEHLEQGFPHNLNTLIPGQSFAFGVELELQHFSLFFFGKKEKEKRKK